LHAHVIVARATKTKTEKTHTRHALFSHPKSADFDVRKEAAWAVSNATAGGQTEQIRYLVNSGCIRPFCDLLGEKVICLHPFSLPPIISCAIMLKLTKTWHQDSNLLLVSLECLENILKVGLADLNANPDLVENPFVKVRTHEGECRF